MKARLFSQTGALAGTEFIIEQEAVIGRDSNCQITLYPHTVSSRHARIYLDAQKGQFFLEDLNSSNGTFLDKTRVEGEMRLGALNVITFAQEIDMIFQVLPAGASIPKKRKPATSAGKKAPKAGSNTVFQEAFVMPSADLSSMDTNAGNAPDSAVDPKGQTTYRKQYDAIPDFGASDAPAPSDETVINKPISVTLQISNVKGERKVELVPGTHSLGRAASKSDIPIQDEYMSGRHAQLRVTPDGVYIQDLGSRNGTSINDQQIDGEVLLEPGVIVKLGPTTKIRLI